MSSLRVELSGSCFIYLLKPAIRGMLLNHGRCSISIRTAILHTVTLAGAAYFVRDSGSYVVGQTRDKDELGDAMKVVDWLLELEFEDVTDEAKALGVAFGTCTYFRATIPEGVEAFENIVLFSELDPKDWGRVRIRMSAHGEEELVMEGLEPIKTDVIHLCLGPDDDGQLRVYFWYPGRMTTKVTLGDKAVKCMAAVIGM